MAAPPRAELLLPAPGRGQYDRAITRERRQAEQRERLLLAVAGAYARGRASVSGAIDLAGVGRNTFYEYFDDYAHALEALRAQVVARIAAAWRLELASARTPLERVRSVCHAWCSALLAERDEALVLLCAAPRTPEEPLSSAGRELYVALEESRRETAQRADAQAELTALAAAGEALALRWLRQTANEPSRDESPASTLSRVAEQVLR